MKNKNKPNDDHNLRLKLYLYICIIYIYTCTKYILTHIHTLGSKVPPAKAPPSKAPPAKVPAAPAPAPPLAPPSQTVAPKSKPNPRPPSKKVARVEVIGDSMLGGIRNWYRNDEYSAKVHSYGGATTQDMNDMLEIALRRDPDALIVHSGTNDFDHKINTKKELQRIVAKARGKKADLKIAISSICFRQDKPHLMPKIKDMNNQLKTFATSIS